MIQPIGDHFLIKRAEKETKFALGVGSSIVVPQAFVDEPDRGTVVGIGPSVFTKEVKVGDRVVFHVLAGAEVMDWEENLFVTVPEYAVLAVLR